jgi:hypothetical protein
LIDGDADLKPAKGSSTPHTRVWLWAIIVLGAALRLAAIPLVHNHGLISDEREYLFLATRLHEGGPFVDSNGEFSVRSPLFPALLALIPHFPEQGLGFPLVAECVAGTLAILLVYLIALSVWKRAWPALVAAGAAALHPGMVVYSTLLLTEMPFVVLMLIFLLLMSRLIARLRLSDSLVLGAVAGVAVLTRAVFLGPFSAMLGFLWMQLRSTGKATSTCLAALAVCLLVLSPWVIRNYQVHHEIVPVSSFSGSSLLMGNNPFTHGSTKFDPGYDAWRREQLRAHGISDEASEYVRTTAEGRIAVEYMAAHPWNTSLLMLEKAYVFWFYPLSHQQFNVPLKAAMMGADVLLYLGAAAGFVAAWHLRKRLGLLLVPLAAFTLLHIVLHAEARYRVPVVPLICVMFGGVTEAWRERLSVLEDPRSLRRALVLAGAIVAIYGLTGGLFFLGKL